MTYQARPLPDALHNAALSTGGAVQLGTPGRQWLRRLCFVVPVLAMTVAGTWLATGLTAGAGPLRPALLALLAANLLFLAVTGWPGVLGFLLRLMRHRTPLAACPNGTSRTAVLFPIYNEDANAVFTAAEVMLRALIEQRAERTDIFVLSDTRDPAIALAEEQAFARLSPLFGDRLRYRRRVQNLRRKAGNIADFCQAWSGEYDYMVVLDADSLMSAASITTLIGLMDANPRAGLIQTVPYAVGRETLFARIQQFAARLYTPLLVEGLAFWQGQDGNYWGHNAIIRIAPFMAHCELPILSGREPFGGEILCHDVVEAAMMRRAGWQVWLLPSLAESYEALPANMVDFAQRERRWCQGNLQHLGVLGMRGLRPVGRYHLALGVLTYLSGPLFVLFAGLATLDGVLGGGFIARLLGEPGPARVGFVALTFFLLYGAKLCSLATVLADDAAAASFGGRLRLLASAVLEQASAMVSAPILLVFYTRFIGMMLLGRTVQWDAQPRDDRGVSWGEAVQRMRLPTAIGAIWLVGASMAGATPLHWALSLVPGLLLAMPASVWTSVASFGLLARRCGLFLTEDELAPSPILRAFNRALVRDAVPLAHTVPHQQFGYLHPTEGEAH
jgi:membrane glycosyltransferase